MIAAHHSQVKEIAAYYMLITLIGLRLQVQPFNCASFQENLWFINVTSEREREECMHVFVCMFILWITHMHI